MEIFISNHGGNKLLICCKVNFSIKCDSLLKSKYLHFKCFICGIFMQMKLFGQIFYEGSSVNCIDFIQMQMNEIKHLMYIDHSRSQKTHVYNVKYSDILFLVGVFPTHVLWLVPCG